MIIEILDDKVIIDGITFFKQIVKQFKLSNKSIEKMQGVHPRLVEVIKKAIVNSPYDFLITHGVRTAEEQNKLYQQGRTIPGIIITRCDGYINKSNHQKKKDGYGYAVDFAIYDQTKQGNVDWKTSEKYIAVANHIIKIAKDNGLIVESGAFWTKIQDYGHIELKGVIK